MNPEVVVSIIVPVYNTEQYLNESLNCLFAQTMKSFEIICVDDSSTDHSLDILNNAAQMDERVKVIQQDHKGAGAARNIGLDAAKGKYVYFFDSDDLCEPNLLELTVEKAEETDADIVAFEFHRFATDGTITKGTGVHTDWINDWSEVFNYTNCPDRIMNVINPTPWNKLYRKSFLDEYHLRYEEISSTNDVTFAAVSAAAARRIAVLKNDLFAYRVGIEGQITASKERSINNVTTAVFSAQRQVKELPHYKDIEFAVKWFTLEIFVASFYRYVKDINLPYVREYYETMHQVFLEEQYDSITKENLKNSRLFLRFQIIRKHEYEVFRAIFDKRMVVSFTSFPDRINCVSAVLNTIYKQTHPADEIVLWLSGEQFPNGEDDLPEDLREMLDEEKFTLKWCNDLKSHKKYFYAFQEYPDDIVVTIDDDITYGENLLTNLFDSYLLNPEAVSAGRVHLITFNEDGDLLPYQSWIRETEGNMHEPSMQLMATGVGGVLYPPHLLDLKMLDETAVREICLHADDLWLKAMEVVADVPVVGAQQYQGLSYVPGSQETSLWKINVTDGENDTQMEKIIQWLDDHYYEGIFKEKLLESNVGLRLVGVEAYLYHAAALLEGKQRVAYSQVRKFRINSNRLTNRNEKLEREKASLKEQNKKLKRKIAKLESENKKLEASCKQQKEQVKKMHNSNSWKIGRMITWLPRKIKKIFRSK